MRNSDHARELQDDLEKMASFGASGAGVTRLAWSSELMDAYDWLGARAAMVGALVRTDAAGNLFLQWAPSSEKRLLIGSHLDTVPEGGRFDGALGVLGGLEAVRILNRAAVELRRPISVVSFMDEEGTRFGTTLFGSRAFVGDDLVDLADRSDATGVTLRQAMAVHGYDFGSVGDAAGVSSVMAYLELHIEQGPMLEHEGIDLGVVTSIVGLLAFDVVFTGQANHAGTTPMPLRRDALAGAARAILELREVAAGTPGVTINVGVIDVEPGGTNVIPGTCHFTVDVRAATSKEFRELEHWVSATLHRVARSENLDLEIRELYRLEPLALDTGLADVLENATNLEHATHIRMPSGAGHDAMALGQHVPTAMLFVPSRAGISHSPLENTAYEHCNLGARVLARAARELLGA